MTARHKDFGSRPKVKTPVTFTVEGETFTCVPAIPGALLLDFIADADSGDGGRASQALIDFLTSVVVEDEKERFTDFLRDPEIVIDVETLAEICEWLVEEYAARPTETPSASPSGRSGRGSGSTARASTKASTSSV